MNQTHMSTRSIRGTPGFVDPLVMNGLQHSPSTDGFAFAITVLMSLVAQPAVGLERKCKQPGWTGSSFGYHGDDGGAAQPAPGSRPFGCCASE